MTSTTIEGSARSAQLSSDAAAGIQAAGRLLVDARLAEWLLCDVYPDRPDEGLRVFWELSGDNLLDAVATLRVASCDSQESLPSLTSKRS